MKSSIASRGVPVNFPSLELLNHFSLLSLDERDSQAEPSEAVNAPTEKKTITKRKNKKPVPKPVKASNRVIPETTAPEKASVGGWGVGKRYVVCIDFEATCDADIPFDDEVHEIIEFPAIAIDTLTNEKVAEFHSYVKPTVKPLLSDFCTKLTGITQDVINQSPTFPVALSKFLAWIDELLLGKLNPTTDLSSEISERHSEDSSKAPQVSGLVLATHGQADILNFFKTTCQLNKIALPSIFKAPFVDIQRTACCIFKKNKEILKQSTLRTKSGKALRTTHSVSLENLCLLFEIPFVGRCHSGLDDARMVATLLQKWALSDHIILSNSS